MASNETQLGSCDALSTRGSVVDYMQVINTTTNGFNESLLELCRSNICNSLWGFGNSDISGIGMIVGYLFETILGFGLAFCIAVLGTTTSNKYKKVLIESYRTFFNCAVFFAFSIQIACVIVLVRRDFSITANGLGAFTTQITWTIALLSMLPLICAIVSLDKVDTKKSGYRFFLFCGCWLMFFYTFISHMIGDFSPSQIQKGSISTPTSVESPAAYSKEWEILENMCLGVVDQLTGQEQNIMSGFGAAGSIVVIGYGLAKLLWLIVSGLHSDSGEKFKNKCSRFTPGKRWDVHLTLGAYFVLFYLTIPQFWAVFRLRDIQKALSERTNNAYTDDQWNFGQVVAVMIFAPVFTEVGLYLISGNIDSH
ncbi:hypothetical protein BJ875DRAFT_276889 [Amylocarpus encephaloides]|uniref:Uncharacterized protein n=1 Tax=Amylocarpus encephaloides TaxID=45428 RepID=A0A9P7YLQ4_9HELO|nr:hypothetical protein BJ875DRAFT_276889 [Amylocarpus encephaloides]